MKRTHLNKSVVLALTAPFFMTSCATIGDMSKTALGCIGGAAVGGVTDGESISISQGFGSTPIVFEFDGNGTVAPGSVAISLNDIVLQVPTAGVGPGGIQDGDMFTINNNNSDI